MLMISFYDFNTQTWALIEILNCAPSGFEWELDSIRELEHFEILIVLLTSIYFLNPKF